MSDERVSVSSSVSIEEKRNFGTVMLSVICFPSAGLIFFARDAYERHPMLATFLLCAALICLANGLRAVIDLDARLRAREAQAAESVERETVSGDASV